MKKDLDQLWDTILENRELIKKLRKYRSNSHYKAKYDKSVLKLNRDYKFFKSKCLKSENTTLIKNLGQLNASIEILLSDKKYDEKLHTIKDLERFWPDIELNIIDESPLTSDFEIPKEIPQNEQRLDLEEAIKDYVNECYPSCLVLCRRAYEGALTNAYQSITKTEPVQDVLCPKCNKKIRTSYIGITKLHNWALKEKLITEKLKSVGFLAADLGAGGAHPPLFDFPRTPEIANLGIHATITLLKEIYSKTQ